ncbi:MAG: hypothetical protein ABIQ60_15495 [Burkholderiaceae bacterium]
MNHDGHDSPTDLFHGIDHSSTAAPVAIPPGHVGEFVIPGTGRRIWWTGRVAIGLLHQPEKRSDPVTRSSLWIQDLLRAKPGRALSAQV